jgi:hypothetical protein
MGIEPSGHNPKPTRNIIVHDVRAVVGLRMIHTRMMKRFRRGHSMCLKRITMNLLGSGEQL